MQWHSFTKHNKVQSSRSLIGISFNQTRGKCIFSEIQVTETFKSQVLCPSPIDFICQEFLCPLIEGITIGRIKDTGP